MMYPVPWQDDNLGMSHLNVVPSAYQLEESGILNRVTDRPGKLTHHSIGTNN
jgi:hypothetical protein